MNLSAFFKKNGIHFIAIFLFFIVAYVYFAPQFNGYGLKQHDIEQYKGMSNEVKHFRESTGEEPLWTNAMFGGMPATQISVIYSGNLLKNVVVGIGKVISVPAGPFLWHLISFYILALCLRIRPVIGIVGAFAFAFASYEIIILQAGHNTKAMAIAFLPAVLGAFILAFRRNWKLGGILSAVFMAMHLGSNHFQITYYALFLLLIFGLYFLIETIISKEYKKFFVSSAAIIGGYLIALMINYGNIFMTNSYANETIRGQNDVSMAPNGEKTSNADQAGLDKDYITNWSYGIDESFTLVTPYAKGSHNNFLIADTRFADIAEDSDMSSQEIEAVLGNRAYFGEQPGTSGPVYIGVIVVFLALLGLVFLKDRIKWVLLGISIFALLLSWGKNFMGLTDFFIENVPLYNKFRTVTMILVLVELCIPIIGILLLQKLYNEREQLKTEKNKFLIVSGVFFVFLVGLKFVGINDQFYSQAEGDYYQKDKIAVQVRNSVLQAPADVLQQNYGVDKSNPQQVEGFVQSRVDGVMGDFDNIKIVRSQIYDKSTTHSLIVGIFGIGIMALFFYTSIPTIVVVIGIGVVSLADLIIVDKNYLNNDEQVTTSDEYQYWMEQPEKDYPVVSNRADAAILASELTENPSLKALVDAGEKRGKEKYEELGYDSKYRDRVIDSYKFSALNLNTNFRVLEYDGLWSSTRASYFHKSLGGYHAAKLQRIQNMFEFHISRRDQNILDMLNVKYSIQGGEMKKRESAMGNGWFVKDVKSYESADQEIRGLGKLFNIINAGQGKLLVNRKELNAADVQGYRPIQYVMTPGDTLDIRLPANPDKNVPLCLVLDSLGQAQLYPLALVDTDSSNQFQKIVEIQLKDEFVPRDEAVMLSSEAGKLSKKKFSGEGVIEMTKYAPNKISYTTSSNDKQLAVFSEVYYQDGWKAYVDGKEQEILKVNYMLRGLELPAGNHKVEFVYTSEKYERATVFSWIGSILLILLAGAYIYFNNRTKPEVVKAKVQDANAPLDQEG